MTANLEGAIVNKTGLIIAMLVSVTASATPVAEQKKRNAIDDATAKASGDLKDCGKKFSIVYDWAAYDAIDWAGIKQDKQEHYLTELSNLAQLGKGLNQLCADKDYKAALLKITKITYRPTNNTKFRVKGTVTGTSLVLENYSFGSTRDGDDYASAAKAAL